MKQAYSPEAIPGWQDAANILTRKIRDLKESLRAAERDLLNAQSSIAVCNRPPTCRNVYFPQSIRDRETHFKTAIALDFPYIAWNGVVYKSDGAEIALGLVEDFGF